MFTTSNPSVLMSVFPITYYDTFKVQHDVKILKILHLKRLTEFWYVQNFVIDGNQIELLANSLFIFVFHPGLKLTAPCRWVLLETLDKVSPGIVNWKIANKPPIKMPFKKVENCNQVVKIGKQLKFSLVNIAGNDIVQGNKKLILGILSTTSFTSRLDVIVKTCQNILMS